MGALVASECLDPHDWAGSWVLCYFGYRRSRIFGYVLVILAVILTALIVGGVLLLAWLMAVSSE